MDVWEDFSDPCMRVGGRGMARIKYSVEVAAGSSYLVDEENQEY